MLDKQNKNNYIIYAFVIKGIICECGGIGRRARLRGVFERVWVQVPPLAPKSPNLIGLVFFVCEGKMFNNIWQTMFAT